MGAASHPLGERGSEVGMYVEEDLLVAWLYGLIVGFGLMMAVIAVEIQRRR